MICCCCHRFGLAVVVLEEEARVDALAENDCQQDSARRGSHKQTRLQPIPGMPACECGLDTRLTHDGHCLSRKTVPICRLAHWTNLPSSKIAGMLGHQTINTCDRCHTPWSTTRPVDTCIPVSCCRHCCCRRPCFAKRIATQLSESCCTVAARNPTSRLLTHS